MELSQWIMKRITAEKGMTDTDLALASSINRTTLYYGLKHNEWSEESLNKLYAFFQREKLLIDTIEPFEYKLRRPRGVGGGLKTKRFLNGLELLAKSKPHHREDALHTAFASVTPECNAFLAIISFGVLPSPLDQSSAHDRIRESIYSASERGLMTLFVTPNEKKVARTKSVVGENKVPSIARFEDGFGRFREGFIRWSSDREIDRPEELADRQFAMVKCYDFEVTAWRNIACYAGCNPTNRYARVDAMLLERGPINQNVITVCPHDTLSEIGMCDYLSVVLDTTSDQTLAVFREEMARRMQVRR